ncbi:SpoIID/LytB domain-containing protein [Oceanidesulfovibrio marinus]|uniref:SpoIID/LytB domain-containing protein n=1 Tax=Oceanidesulfovibrio marinus TaxID=370038 RepID=A0ABX6NCS7_9BACT|nr:SpoIID/LytB domain-containing protein [Oceanidesulfovibrio marinus]QJT07550.1 SpoIID/LytB domain-containing protein [Oceanidesulfovibrio marinus]
MNHDPAHARFTGCLCALIVGGLLCASPCIAQDSAGKFDPDPMLRRAHMLFDSGQMLESIALYEDIARMSADPDYTVYCYVRVADVLALFLDQRELALTYYDKVIREYPGNWNLANAYFNSAMLLFAEHRYEDATKRFQRYLELFPEARKTATARYMIERMQKETPGPAPVPGVDKTPMPEAEPMVRVLLITADSLQLEFPHSVVMHAASGRRDKLAPGTYRLRVLDGGVSMEGRGLGEEVSFDAGPHGFAHAGRSYAGEAVVSVQGGSMTLINRLPMEQYLEGVVPSEMPPSFAPAALRAQAVAARTFAWRIVTRTREAGKPYDLSAGMMDQAYLGMGVANVATQDAVRLTRGQVLLYHDAPAFTAFHAHSGGVLEDDAAVWSANMPYLKVADDERSEDYKSLDWEYRIAPSELARLLKRNGFSLSRVEGLRVDGRSTSGRIAEVAVTTDDGVLHIRGNSFRLLVGPARMRSLLCDVSRDEDGQFVFNGRGYGHGVGMSQWGAQAMAYAGKDYKDILSTYYPGTTLRALYN